MTGPILAAVLMLFFGLTFVAWRRYRWVAEQARQERGDTCQYSLTDCVSATAHLVNVPHQAGVQLADRDLQPLRRRSSRITRPCRFLIPESP